jgi:hypothetical protein
MERECRRSVRVWVTSAGQTTHVPLSVSDGDGGSQRVSGAFETEIRWTAL